MIDRIIRYSLQHKFVVLLLVLAIIGGGLYSLRTINVDSTPDITNNQVQVITTAENLSTTDIEQFVTYPVELAMANLPGVEDIRSVSRFGLSVVTVVFRDDMETYLPRQLVQEKLEEVREQIPEGFGTPEIGPISTGLGEIYQYTLRQSKNSKKSYTPQELRTIQDWIVKRQMAMIPGVVEVNSFGGSIKQYEISLSSEQLNARHVAISEVFDALSKNNVNTGGAYIERNHMSNFIRGEGLVKSVEDIENIAVKTEGGIPVLIRDVAEAVHFGEQVRYGAFTQDGHEAVGGMILMLKGANSGKVVADVKERIKEVQKSLPEGLEIKPFLDRSQLIDRTTGTIARNLIEGALIVVLVLVLLMGSLRGGLVTASVIPLALLFAFILMRIFGVWANLMSLGAIDFGIIVDGAVIIVEAVAVKIKKSTTQMHDSMDEVCSSSASTMMGSAFFGQLIILLVFAPILFLTGVSGKMFQPMAYTFSFAIVGAIILCLTYVPVACSVFLRPAKEGGRFGWFARFENKLEAMSKKLVGRLQKAYEPLLVKALRYKKISIALAVILFAATGFLFSRMGGEFIPSLDEGDIAMQTFLRPGSSLSETIKREEEVEKVILKNFPEVKTVCARIGVADIPTDPMGFDYTDSFIILEKDMSKWTSASSKEELIEKIKEKLEELPGLNYSFSQPVELRFNELLTGIREDIAVKLYGEDLDTLNILGERMEELISKVPGAEDVSLERTAGLPQITVNYDRQKVGQYGLNIEKLNQYVSAAFAGGKAGVIFEGEKRFDMVIRLDKKERTGIEDIENLYIDLPDGQLIPLKELADISYKPGPMQISREQASRRIYVGVNVRGRDVESVVDDIQKRLDRQLHLPAGYHITYGGEFENLQQAKERMTIVMPVAMLLIFVLLYFALHNLRQSLLIYMAVPLSTIGGILALWLRGMPFSISAGVGFIVLFGVAVLNGLVLINRFNTLKERQLKASETGEVDLQAIVIRGTRERLRPILLTAMSAMLGFLPMAVSDSAGAEVQRPLATVVIGGLVSATLLTLVIIPILYTIEERISMKRNTAAQVVTLLLILFMLPAVGEAQTVLTLEKARQMAVESYPSLRSARLRVESQRSMQKAAFDIGDTEISTGAEEKGNGNAEGITNIITVRQNLNILGYGAKKNLYSSQTRLAEAQAVMAETDLLHQVSMDYATALIAGKKKKVYEHLDSLYSNFEHAAKLRFETEATGKLEYLSAQNQARKISLQLQQAANDEHAAMIALSRWVNPNAEGAMQYILDDSCLKENAMLSGEENTASLQLARANVDLADMQLKQEKTEFLPKIYAEYGSQKIGSTSGYYSWQVGVSVPLFFGAQAAKTKSAKAELEAAKTDLQATEIEQRNCRMRNEAQIAKIKASKDYYEQTALPLAREQEQVALRCYIEGATDYLGFIMNAGDAIQSQLDYLDCLEQYLTAKFNYEFNK